MKGRRNDGSHKEVTIGLKWVFINKEAAVTGRVVSYCYFIKESRTPVRVGYMRDRLLYNITTDDEYMMSG